MLEDCSRSNHHLTGASLLFSITHLGPYKLSAAKMWLQALTCTVILDIDPSWRWNWLGVLCFSEFCHLMTEKKQLLRTRVWNNALPQTAFIWIYATLVLHDLKTFLEACIYNKRRSLWVLKKSIIITINIFISYIKYMYTNSTYKQYT